VAKLVPVPRKTDGFCGSSKQMKANLGRLGSFTRKQ